MTPLAGAAGATGNGLEDTLSAVEMRLAALSEALRTRDLGGIDRQAVELHGALATAVDTFCIAVRSGPVSPALRSRLVAASGQVAAQRESLARATSALDRAIDVLMPREAPAVYAAAGSAKRAMGIESRVGSRVGLSA
ncbi:MAG: hypothetical protein AD742_03210 [Methylibium sp. NZG]|nr:MAG: hypothetical protein AD742_03210 [Methylibium sp. NZG]